MTKSKQIESIGVIGAGQMGSGIAHVAALSGLNVLLLDMSADALTKAITNIGGNMDRQVKKQAISEDDKKAALARIKTSTDYKDFNKADLVIEAATENEEIKKKIFASLVPHLNKDAYICSNTSSISITRLAAVTDRPERFMGMHFMNPVPVMKLVELIRGIQTSDETYTLIKALAERLGKTVASADDYPGFIVNRVLIPMINEAIYALNEGVGSVTSIDTAMKLGANHPMGPFELADFIGLDTCLAIMQVLQVGLLDGKYHPSPLLVKYVEAGWLGRKTGRGFYDYRGETPVPTRK